MNEAATIPTSVSLLVGRRVLDDTGAVCGRVHEFAVDVGADGTRVAGIILNGRAGGETVTTLLPVGDMLLPEGEGGELRAKNRPTEKPKMDAYLLLERDLLDQQIIDVDGHKVVRVNDVNLLWEQGAELSLLIQEVEVGMRGAARRLLKGLPAGTVESASRAFPPRVIPWGCVDLIERDPARRVRLKIGQERLSKLHPSDIADILEELAPAEREAVFSSLPEETAAEALEEIEPKLQKELLQRMDSEHAADILEEMDPGAAADVLGSMTEEESEAILEEMEPEERHEVEELLEFPSNSAAGLMTTDFVSVAKEASVADAVEALRQFEGDPDTITEIYLLGKDEVLAGVVMLPRLLLATPETELATLSEGHNVSCTLHTSDKDVAALFDKYNLRSLPVLNHHRHIAGAIHAEQVIAQLREG